MIPPTSIDGTDITGATIDGTEVTEITVDGDTVFSAGTEISEDFEAGSLPTDWSQHDNGGGGVNYNITTSAISGSFSAALGAPNGTSAIVLYNEPLSGNFVMSADFRLVSNEDANIYGLTIADANQYQDSFNGIYERDNNSILRIGYSSYNDYSSFSSGFNQVFSIELEYDGSDFRLSINGTEEQTHTDFLPSEYYVGYGVQEAGVHVDNFSFENL
jgi:hypothetical protein